MTDARDDREVIADAVADAALEFLIECLYGRPEEDYREIADALLRALGDRREPDGSPPLRPMRVKWRSGDPLDGRSDMTKTSEGDVVGFLNEGRTHGPSAVVLFNGRLVLAPFYTHVSISS